MAIHHGGLSPRVRGNRQRIRSEVKGLGSIPACAGEPACLSKIFPLFAVYPRVCGGTAPDTPSPPAHTGLSPRVRGNPYHNGPPFRYRRSIPACAGEPGLIYGPAWSRRVYPRVCGGTASYQRGVSTDRGLSPRVRGNPHGSPQFGVAIGSIPACAGEPQKPIFVAIDIAVYPRVCGGTLISLSPGQAAQGLSPRVRGNRHRSPTFRGWPRSIPACAGEPLKIP